jgi:hypothetical protein
MKRITLLGMLLVFATAPLQAQTSLQRAKAALPRDAARALEQTVVNARKRGLPTEPLVDKALEGVAKRMPPATIVNAVRQKVDLLARADAALRPYGPPTAADVTSTADVLQRGLPVDVVKKVRAGRRKGEPVGLSLHTVADLMDRRVPAPVAVEVINSWRQRGGQNERLRELPAEVEKLIRMGASPSAAGRSVAEAAREGRPPTRPGKPGDRPTSRRDQRDRGGGTDGAPVRNRRRPD